MSWESWLGLIGVLVLVAVRGLLAAIRSAFASTRRGRLRQMVEEGVPRADMAAALADWHDRTIDDLCRNITCSNELRKRITWLVDALPAARDAERLSLADLKRLMANRDFGNLKRLLRADLAARHLPLKAWEVLDSRAHSVHPAAVQPAPLVRGDDLIAMGVPAGPIYKEVLDAVYTAQLNEQIHTREEALKLTRRLLNERGFPVPE